MTRNQKIALGCGGAGCLGLIVVVIAGGLGYYFYMRQAPTRASRSYNFNVNLSESNSNSNANDNTSDSNFNSNANSSASTSLSDDTKHKLFHAASVTGDAALIQRVNVKIGILNDDFTPGDEYQQFAIDHVTWAFRNSEFIREINSAEKARAYVNENFPE